MEVSDEQIGSYWFRHIQPALVGIPDDGAVARMRAQYIRDVRANPEALRQLAEELHAPGGGGADGRGERLRDGRLLQHGLAVAEDVGGGDLQHPVIYMSRATVRDVWRRSGWGEPDLREDLLFGSMPVLFDDRMELGVASLEEDPDPKSTSAGSAGSPGREG